MTLSESMILKGEQTNEWRNVTNRFLALTWWPIRVAALMSVPVMMNVKL